MFLIVSAKIWKFAAPRGMSTCEARCWGLPVSAISACRKSSKRRLISTATASSIFTRSTTDSRPQGPFRAACAARTAASTSA